MKIVPSYLPEEFGVLLLMLAVIFTIAPYAAGHDFGVFKVPSFNAKSRKSLKWIGPLALLAAVLLHAPLPIKACEEPIYEKVTDEALCGTVQEEYIATPAAPKRCRHPAFGQEGWRYSEEISGSSGWMSGGLSQPDWCNRLIARELSSRSISSQHESDVLGSSERGRWTGPFNRTREYNYNCTVRISWEPIYAEKVDGEVCGISPEVKMLRSVPATCDNQVGTREVYCDT